MTWFKVDDAFESHPKVKSIPKRHRARAVGLWTLAGSWSARQLTDGNIPAYMLEELCATKADAALLTAAGLWITTDSGYQFKDWCDWQPTRAKVEAEREAAKERMRAARERKKDNGSPLVRANNAEHPPNVQERSREVRSTHGSPTPTRPDPTRPDPKEECEPASAGSDGKPSRNGVVASYVPQPTAQNLIAEWIDHCPERPPGRVIGQVSKELKTLIDEGVDPDRLRPALAEWNRKGLHPSTLASVVHEITNRRPAARGQQATDDLFDRAMQRAIAKEQAS